MKTKTLHRFGLSLALLVPCAAVMGQGVGAGPAVVTGDETSGEGPEWMKRLSIDPAGPVARRYTEQQRVRVAAEKTLRKIRAKHFGPIRNVQIRQEGIVQLREFTDPALFESMIRLFEREAVDVRTALLDHFQDSKSPEGDAAIAWMGIFDADAEVRGGAIFRVKKRIEAEGSVPMPVKYAVFEGMRSGDKDAVSASAKLAAGIQMYDAIPWMIASLVTGQPVQTPQQQAVGLGGNGRQGALAWIMVGQQTAFVSDLTPVVGPSAVAFDPQLSVINEGVVLRVMDAVVVTYRVDIFNTLTDFTETAWGQPTKQLGWNVPAWREWYTKEFVPEMKRREEAKQAAATGTVLPPK